MPSAVSAARLGPAGSITDVAGIKVGHFTDKRRPTGCTVLLVESGAIAGVDVRGGAPGTHETDLLNPINSVAKIHAIVLSGGSAFGLAAADGVMKFLEEKGIGFSLAGVRVPIVPAAILFDLGVGDPRVRPTAEAGYEAASRATTQPVDQGNIGAGAGATVGKWLASGRAMKGGLGSASFHLSDGATIGALAAVNAVGDVVDPGTGQILAGMRTADGKALADTMAQFRKGLRPAPRPAGMNTTLGIVATDAELTKAEATKIAQMAHDGLARAIRPAHLPLDGDTIFAVATGKRKLVNADIGLLGVAAAEAMASAIIAAVLHAKGIPGFPAYADLASGGAQALPGRHQRQR